MRDDRAQSQRLSWIVWLDSRELADTAAWIIFALVLLGSAALAVWYICAVGFNTVWADLWGYIGPIGAVLGGHFDHAELFSIHNAETRPILLRAILFVSAKTDHLNLIHVEYLSVCFAIATVLLLLWFSIGLFKTRSWALACALCCISVATLSLTQWWNFALPINVVFFSMVTFSVLAIFFVGRHLSGTNDGRLSWNFAAAALFSELALASINGGVVVWIVVVIQILLSRPKKALLTSVDLALYAALGCISILSYIHGFQADYRITGSDPVMLLEFMIAGIGNALAGAYANQPLVGFALAVGAVLWAYFIFVVWSYFKLPKLEQGKTLVFLCLMMLGAGEVLLIALGRSSLGLVAATSSEYSTLALSAVMGAMLFLAYRSRESRTHAVLAIAFGVFVCVVAVLGDHNEMPIAAGRRSYFAAIQTVLGRVETQGQDLTTLRASSIKQIDEGKLILRQFGLSQFAHQESPVVTRAFGQPGTGSVVLPPGIKTYTNRAVAAQHGIYAGGAGAVCCFLAGDADLELIKPSGTRTATLLIWVPAAAIYRIGATLDVRMVDAPIIRIDLKPGPNSVEVAIPTSKWAAEIVGVTLHSTRVFVPAAQGTSGDTRTLSVILRGITYK